MSEITICFNCQHFRHKDQSRDVWYNHHCGAMPLPMAADPVTGRTMHYKQNDLGKSYFTEEAFAYCRDVNDGNCKHFTAKQQQRGFIRRLLGV